MPFVAEDQTLFDVLARNAADLEVESIRGELFSTESWYYRLARASAMGSGFGSLSGRLFDCPRQIRSACGVRWTNCIPRSAC